jgi:cellulose biosynthesis protein BcsQ
MIKSSLLDRVAYRRAQDSGRSLTETSFKTLNERAVAVVQEIVNLAQKSNKG